MLKSHFNRAFNGVFDALPTFLSLSLSISLQILNTFLFIELLILVSFQLNLVKTISKQQQE